MEEIICRVKDVVFSNPNTGFHVIRVLLDNANGSSTTTVKGSFPGINIGSGLRAKFRGRYENHSTYGRQFHANTCEVFPEKTRSGIVSYLMSHVKTIGPVTAARMYDAIGENLLDVLTDDPESIRNLPFLTKRQADAVISEWSKASESRTASIFLMDLGLNVSQVKSAYSNFGAQVRDVILENPYRLHECRGIGFPTADTVARKLGVGVDDLKRVRAMVLYAIEEMAFSDGHMFVTSSQIKAYAGTLFKRRSIEPFTHGEYLSDTGLYYAISYLKQEQKLVSDGDRIYLRHNWMYENESASCLKTLLESKISDVDKVDDAIGDYENKSGIELSDEQRQAVQLLKLSKVCVVSGFPGTGKTTVLSAFVHLFDKLNFDYVLLSPTGIAAKRVSQVTGKPASTIHRALGYDGNEWAFNASNKFVVDAVIVDEMSMVDGETFYRLISALHPSTIVLFVGDSAQLPSVGAGYVFNNLINCPSIPHVSLTRIYRQEGGSDIVKVAHAMLKDESIDTSFNESSEFVFLQMPLDKVIGEISKLTTLLKERKTNFQVIAPMYDGDLGVNSLNRELRCVLNSTYNSGSAVKMKHGDTDVYEGDRVMIVRNDYQRMVFNGDVGKIQRISLKRDEIVVKVFDWFDHESPVPRYVDKIFTFRVDEAKSMLKVAFACTSHKVQGQEFDYVIMPMTMRYGIMLYRNLVYTAMTRAKKKVFLFGDAAAFSYAVSNNREIMRNSGLSDLVTREATDV